MKMYFRCGRKIASLHCMIKKSWRWSLQIISVLMRCQFLLPFHYCFRKGMTPMKYAFFMLFRSYPLSLVCFCSQGCFHPTKSNFIRLYSMTVFDYASISMSSILLINEHFHDKIFRKFDDNDPFRLGAKTN